MTATVIRLLLYGILYAALVFGLLFLGGRFPLFDRAHFSDRAYLGVTLVTYLVLLFGETRFNMKWHPSRTYWAGFILTAETGIIWAIALTTYGTAEGFYRIVESPVTFFGYVLGCALWAGAFGVMGVVLTAFIVWAVFRNRSRIGDKRASGDTR